MRRALVASLFFTTLISATTLFTTDTFATTAGFKAGEIMDDTVMTNAKSVSVSQIQTFLNSKVPTCDTNGQQLSEYGGPDLNNDGKVQRWEWGKANYNQTKFICLKNWKNSSGTSAAQIIYNKAQGYSINPQVLIVLLQKEQGLVTDTWPLNIQYRTATGYGCPDTAPCDSQYYGLENQLDWAAKMYHSIITQDPNWYTPYIKGYNPTVYWHPDTSRCGSAPLTMANWTTASLYSYTPYRPNQASLDAGYGTGNSCSSYGNRNFYNYFTDWFGYTTTPLFKLNNGDATIYLSYGDTYYPIPSQRVLYAYGLAGKRVTTISTSQLSSYTKGSTLGLVVKYGSDATVYLVDNGKLHAGSSWTMFNHYGYGSGDLVTFSDTNFINALNTGKGLSQLARRSNGAIYFVSTDKLHVFPDYATYMNKASAVSGMTNPNYDTYSDALLNSIPESSPVLMDGVTVTAKDTAAIFLHDNDKLLVFTPSTWKEWGRTLNYSFGSYDKLNDITAGGYAPLFITDGTNKFIVASGQKVPVSDATLTQLGIDSTPFTTLSSRSLNRLSTSSTNIGTLLRTHNGTVYKVIGAKKYAIASGTDFTGLGYRWVDVVTVDNSVTDKVSSGSALLFAPGSLIRTPDGAVSLIDDNLTRHIIPSMESFNNYGFSWKNVRNYPANTLTDYTADTLQGLAIVSASGPYVLADNSMLFSVGSTAYGTSWYDMATWQKTSISSKIYGTLKLDKSLTRYVKGSGATVYKIENGKKRAFSSASKFYSDGGSWSQVTYLSDSLLASIPAGIEI